VLLLLLRGKILPATFFKLACVVKLQLQLVSSVEELWARPEMDIKGLTRLWAALRSRETIPESGIFSGWVLSAAYTCASTA